MIDGEYDSWQQLAGEDLTGAGALHKGVTANGKIAQDITMFIGFLKSKGNTGESVRIAIDGVVKGIAGAAITTPGTPIAITTSGFCSVGTSTIPFVGRALAAAASGDLFPIMICQ